MGAPSGARVSVTEIDPALWVRRLCTAEEVCLPEPLRCVHPLVLREETTNSSSKIRLNLISHLHRGQSASHHRPTKSMSQLDVAVKLIVLLMAVPLAVVNGTVMAMASAAFEP
jgi:hypothetical protein